LSRNRDRVGSPAQSADAPSPAVMQDASAGGFSFVVPTEFVELPSQGKYYPESHPLCGETSIEIRQMTAKDEDLLTSRALIKKGVVLDRLIQNLIVDKTIDSDSLLIGDRNAIIIATRVSGYGSEYVVQVNCPNCGERQEYDFDLNEANVYYGDDPRLETLHVTNNENGTHNTTLPRSGVTVTFRLFTGQDEKAIIKIITDSRKRNLEEKNVTRQLNSMIVAVDSDGSREAINYFVNNMPSIDSRHLRTVFEMATPNVDLTQVFECSECTHVQDMEVPLTAEFFWPDR